MNKWKSKWPFAVGVIVVLLLLGAWFVWSIPMVDSASLPQSPEDYPDFVSEHHYSIFVLGDDMSPCLVMDAYQLLHERYGDLLFTWGVREISGTNYVMAYPGRSLLRYAPTQRALMQLVSAYQ